MSGDREFFFFNTTLSGEVCDDEVTIYVLLYYFSASATSNYDFFSVLSELTVNSYTIIGRRGLYIGIKMVSIYLEL